jgi:hypothetical protein
MKLIMTKRVRARYPYCLYPGPAERARAFGCVRMVFSAGTHRGAA